MDNYLHLERKYKINSFLGKEFIPSDFFDKDDIQYKMDDIYLYIHMTGQIDHSLDDPKSKVSELYWNLMTSRLVSELGINLKEKDEEIFIEWVKSFYK